MKAESVELVYVLTTMSGERWFDSKQQLDDFCKDSNKVGTFTAKIKIVFEDETVAMLKPDSIIE